MCVSDPTILLLNCLSACIVWNFKHRQQCAQAEARMDFGVCGVAAVSTYLAQFKTYSAQSNTHTTPLVTTLQQGLRNVNVQLRFIGHEDTVAGTALRCSAAVWEGNRSPAHRCGLH